MVFETGGNGWDGGRTQVQYPILCPRALLTALLPRGRVSLPMVRRAMLSVLLSRNKQLQDIQCLIGKAKIDPSTNCRTCSRLSVRHTSRNPHVHALLPAPQRSASPNEGSWSCHRQALLLAAGTALMPACS